MLILTRKQGQSIHIGNDIMISVTRIQNGQISLGIDAPRDVPVHRKEIFEKIAKESANDASTKS